MGYIAHLTKHCLPKGEIEHLEDIGAPLGALEDPKNK